MIEKRPRLPQKDESKLAIILSPFDVAHRRLGFLSSFPEQRRAGLMRDIQAQVFNAMSHLNKRIAKAHEEGAAVEDRNTERDLGMISLLSLLQQHGDSLPLIRVVVVDHTTGTVPLHSSSRNKIRIETPNPSSLRGTVRLTSTISDLITSVRKTRPSVSHPRSQFLDLMSSLTIIYEDEPMGSFVHRIAEECKVLGKRIEGAQNLAKRGSDEERKIAEKEIQELSQLRARHILMLLEASELPDEIPGQGDYTIRLEESDGSENGRYMHISTKRHGNISLRVE